MPHDGHMADLAGRALRPATPAKEVRVWDILVRVFHWGLVAAFITAYASAEEWDALHEIAGFTVMGLVAFRLLWGFVGSRHARFADFIYRPKTVLTFLKDSIKLRGKRYLGHNPAGGAMVIALLLDLVVITGTGFMMTTDAFWGQHWVKEIHEIAVNGGLILVALHLAGVVLASFEHRENLVRSMVTGKKRAPSELD